MRLLFPDNLFTRLFLSVLPDSISKDVSFTSAASVSGKLEAGEADIAIIPSLDLMKHPAFFVSSQNAISFDGNLSNSYLYFNSGRENIRDIYFAGDVSVNEVLLSKILFKEKYSTEIEIHLESSDIKISEKNYLVTGDFNLKDSLLDKQFSFSDELSSMLELPYVNFVVASTNEENIRMFSEMVGNLDQAFETRVAEIIDSMHLEEGTSGFIESNINSIYFEMTESEKDGLSELLKLPYYLGIVNQMQDINFI